MHIPTKPSRLHRELKKPKRNVETVITAPDSPYVVRLTRSPVAGTGLFLGVVASKERKTRE
jgi:hypothetical protein